MISVAPQPSGRRAARYKVFEPATVVIGTQRARAHLLNVSATGAFVHTEFHLQIGMRIKLHIGEWSSVVYVVRTAKTHFGVVFAAPIDVHQIDRLTHRASAEQPSARRFSGRGQ